MREIAPAERPCSNGSLRRFILTVNQTVLDWGVDESWTLSELVDEAKRRIAALPAPKNGQVRAVPDDRTVRYYGTLGLLDRPTAMRGRTALYGKKHLAQIVAIKRLQTAGRSLAEIAALWPTLDAPTLQRMSGIELPAATREFWKANPAPMPTPHVPIPIPTTHQPIQMRVQVAPGKTLLITVQLEETV